ncbi:MAG TPA: D-glucuronyl C5-epimerase family protein, partial [Miltoncostaeaceae bacterium]|nr:D-glucuronyl C5-epimerase family protein [Miltoncostaeaceae bacterium]
DEPADPPAGIAIPAAEASTGRDPARRALVAALASAAPGSAEDADIRRQLGLWSAYLAPDAAAAPQGRRATIARAVRANAWWFAARGSPSGRVLLRDEDGVILTYRPGQGFAVNPVATTGRWGGLNDDVPAGALAAALMEMGVERVAGDRRFVAWEYYDVADDPAAIRPGTSAMAQGRVALLMAHAHARGGDPRFERAALDALAAFVVPVDRGGVRSMVATAPTQEPAPWYVERAYPDESPWKGAALNGFMVTILNLRGAAAVLDRGRAESRVSATAIALARDLADRGAVTLERHLADHDSGSWSYYGLLTPGRPWRSYLADLNYHCYHVRLLGALAEPYPERSFGATAARWQGYVDRAGAACPER